jgi:hypothetical protein
MTMSDDDARLVGLLAPLGRIESIPFRGEMRQAQLWFRRPALVIAVGIVALTLVGVAIAAGFGGFSGFSATQHPQTVADQLDAQTLAGIKTACSSGAPDSVIYNPYCHLELDTARYLTDTGPRGKVWIVTDTRGDLCAVGGFGGCYAPLSKSQPITFGASQPGPVPGVGGTFTAAGLAIDGVTSVSFVPVPGDGKQVTVPVKDNIWIYREPNTQASDGRCIVAHFADGSTVSPFPEIPCP